VTLRNEAKRKGRRTGKSSLVIVVNTRDSAPRGILSAILVPSNGYFRPLGPELVAQVNSSL
jgi:hypothetical protein